MLFIFVMFAFLLLGHSQGQYQYGRSDVANQQQQQQPQPQQHIVAHHQLQQPQQYAVQHLQPNLQQPQQLIVQQQPQPIKYYVVQTLGPQGRAYELQMQKSQPIYVKHQAETVQGNQLAYASTVAQRQQQYYQAPASQHPTQSGRTNPLLSNIYRYPQSSQGVPAQGLTPPQPRPAVASSKSTATAINAQPYAIVQLTGGHSTQDGGHGSGAIQSANTIAPAHDHPIGARVGDYNSQSQTSQLDSYFYKQSVLGDGRAYQRFVTTCQPNGQCQRLKLTHGQTEPGHQKFLMAARAKTFAAQDQEKGPSSSTSTSSNAASQADASYYRGGAAAAIADSYTPPGAKRNASGQMRPRDRRNFAYREQPLLRYPYN